MQGKQRFDGIPEDLPLPHGTCVFDGSARDAINTRTDPIALDFKCADFAISIDGELPHVVELPTDDFLVRYVHVVQDSQADLGISLRAKGKFYEVVSVRHGSWAQEKAIKVGDLLTDLNRVSLLDKDISDINEVWKERDSQDESVVISLPPSSTFRFEDMLTGKAPIFRDHRVSRFRQRIIVR